MNPRELERAFRATLSDLRLESSERKSLRELLGEQVTTDGQRAQLRSLAFKLAREAAALPQVDFARVLGWLEEMNKLLLPPALVEESFATAAFSPGDACANIIIGQLDAARLSADVCVFTITDNRITAALERAHRRGVGLRIITDNDKMMDEGSDAERLARLGIPLRVDHSAYHMHHKFALFDGRILLNGSYNWTRGAAQYNEENVVATNEPRLIHAFSEIFERLWTRLENAL